MKIPLTKHTQIVLSDPSLKFGSVSFTACTICIAFSKEMAEVEPSGLIGIDRNVDNATVASSDNSIRKFDTTRITQMKGRYSEVMSENDFQKEGMI